LVCDVLFATVDETLDHMDASSRELIEAVSRNIATAKRLVYRSRVSAMCDTPMRAVGAKPSFQVIEGGHAS
jgi:hypothetical protein